jgi:hypothetical protein
MSEPDVVQCNINLRRALHSRDRAMNGARFDGDNALG